MRMALTAFLLLMLLSSAGSMSSAGAVTTTPIEHVVIIMQENHSFDNYFGTYPTANGTLVTPITSKLTPVDGIPDSVCIPYNNTCLRLQLTTSTHSNNPVEGQLTYEGDYQNNATGFAEFSGPQSLVYFDYHSVAAYWDYAEEYGLADNYFSAVLSQTTPNRLMILAGDSPVSADYGPPPYVPYNDTIMSQLGQAGVTWGYYDELSAFGGPSNVYPLNYTSGMSAKGMSNVQDLSSLYAQLASSSGLPAVSFVNNLGNMTSDEHPPSNPTAGESWVVSIVNRVMQSAYWNTTAIFITWDEGGGFYDNVVPPAEFSIDNGFAHPLIGLGQRVPLLVISPYSNENYVSDSLLSHLSLLHFIEYNWGLPALNPNVASSGLPLDFFNFTQSPRPPIEIGNPAVGSLSSYPLPLQSSSNELTPNKGGPAPPNNQLLLGSTIIGILGAASAGAILLAKRAAKRPLPDHDL